MAATVRTTTRRADTSRPPIDRTERPSLTGRVEAFFSLRFSEGNELRPDPSRAFCFRAFLRVAAEALSPFEDFAACAAALRWRDFSALISRVVRAASEDDERRRGEGREDGRRLGILLSCPKSARLAQPHAD